MMFKNLVLAIVIILTMCVSSIANVSIVEYDTLNIDACVVEIDVCYTAYIIEYVVDDVIYTPVVYHTCVNVNNNITNNNTTMVASATTHSDTVSNNNNNTTTHATSVVDSIVYTHDATIHTNSVVDNSIHTTSVVDTHTSIDAYTSAIYMATREGD